MNETIKTLMSRIEIRQALSRRETHTFLTFPYTIYGDDPLWVPPLLPERKKMVDPERGKFFQDGYADLFIAWRENKPVGTISCAEDRTATQIRGFGECQIGFFECIEDYAVAEALFDCAADWAREHNLVRVHGTYNLDREDSRGILVEGRDRPPAVYCGHTAEYYPGFFERYGFKKHKGDGLAYAVDLDISSPRIQRLLRLANRIQARKEITVRGARLEEIDQEIDRVVDLQNRALAHMPEFAPYTHAAIESMILPLVEVADPELVLFAEINGEAVGWFPAIPNLNEVLIHLNGLRYPWDYLRYLRYARYKPKSISIKSVVVPPEYWDTGVTVIMLAEMARRAVAKGYTWADMSLTGEDNLDTWPLAHKMGAKIYKRYRYYVKYV
jgi:GNAT superfamily N-acetyltransferase